MISLPRKWIGKVTLVFLYFLMAFKLFSLRGCFLNWQKPAQPGWGGDEDSEQGETSSCLRSCSVSSVPETSCFTDLPLMPPIDLKQPSAFEPFSPDSKSSIGGSVWPWVVIDQHSSCRGRGRGIAVSFSFWSEVSTAPACLYTCKHTLHQKLEVIKNFCLGTCIRVGLV